MVWAFIIIINLTIVFIANFIKILSIYCLLPGLQIFSKLLAIL